MLLCCYSKYNHKLKQLAVLFKYLAKVRQSYSLMLNSLSASRDLNFNDFEIRIHQALDGSTGILSNYMYFKYCTHLELVFFMLTGGYLGLWGLSFGRV